MRLQDHSLKAVLLAALLAGLPAMGATRIRDTVYSAVSGQRAEGQVTITWPSFVVGGRAVIAGRVVMQLVSGVVALDLEPNDAAIPAGTRYTVQYRLKDGTLATEYWAVPTSAAALTIAAVRVVSPTPVVGQCLRWTGLVWVAADCGGGPGGGLTWGAATRTWASTTSTWSSI